MTRGFVKIHGSKTVICHWHVVKITEMGDGKGLGDEVEDVILQVLSHTERRNILRIIDSSEGGISYSSILGDTGLSTGRLNYHLKELSGFIERDDERRYHLTALGKKALSILRYTTEDLGDEYEGYVSKARANRKRFIDRSLSNAFYFLAVLFLLGPVAATFIMWSLPEAVWALPLIWFVTLVIIYAMDRVRKKSPRHIMGLIDWLDWKLFDENGRNGGGFRGSKLFVGLLIGVILGAAMGKVGLGILLGLFIGAAMNI